MFSLFSEQMAQVAGPGVNRPGMALAVPAAQVACLHQSMIFHLPPSCAMISRLEGCICRPIH